MNINPVLAGNTVKKVLTNTWISSYMYMYLYTFGKTIHVQDKEAYYYPIHFTFSASYV